MRGKDCKECPMVAMADKLIGLLEKALKPGTFSIPTLGGAAVGGEAPKAPPSTRVDPFGDLAGRISSLQDLVDRGMSREELQQLDVEDGGDGSATERAGEEATI